ncbi:unhealthy ribosome biogenesis protein 2 homolog [Spea bombifrons]|uniref:unhealthy ribosome biogenesis protein 2 homolog n=1 Tax=Spea bombifrons TaxID=233779 RepID=UPI0023493EA3|nr:unhealthy ribosome biogenesis protein 2 homolog [Spea bombifrons]
MAAVYSGIHLKLKNSKTPWEDKIKLAHFAWISNQCILPNKEQVLLDWVSHALVGCHTKKIALEEDLEQKLWSFLDNILHSKKLQSLVKEGKSVKLGFTIAQVINECIASSCATEGSRAGLSTVLSCCQGILSTPALSFVYTAKCELMVELLRNVSMLACHYLASAESITAPLFDVLQMSFTQYLQIQRQQSNPNRVFTHVLSQLFQPCLLLRHSLNTRSWGKEDDSRVRHQLSKDIRSKLETVLQMGLFQSELLSSYKEELLSEVDQVEKKKGSVKTLLKPVGSMMSKLEDSSFCDKEIYFSVLANSVPLLYKLFLDSYCKDGNQLVCFHMLARLFECLQSSVLKQAESSSEQPSWSMGLFALEQILNLVLSHDIYNVAVDRIRHREIQYNFFRKLSEMLVCNPCTSVSAWFRCLKTLILLNHLIVEPDLDDLVSCAWIDADILDSRVRKAQETLIVSLLQTYAKLRQFPKLFEEVLIVIYRPAADELRQPVFSPGLSKKLSELLLELPPNQLLDIWSMVLEKCSTVILPGIKDDADMALKLFSLGSILHCLIFNMKSMDNNTPVPVIARFQNLMKKMMDEFIKPSLNLIKNHSVDAVSSVWLQKLCDVTLLLIYTWLEVDTMTKLNCTKYTSQLDKLSTAVEYPGEGWDLSLLLEDKECWETMVTLAKGPVSKYCLGLLCIQKIKYILMQNRSMTETDFLALRSTSSFILHVENDFLSKECEPWCGSASAVDANCFPVAHWYLVISNLLIIHPYISPEDTHQVAAMLLDSLLLSDKEDQEDHDTMITLKTVSDSLLSSDFFPEMRILQCAFVTAIIKKCTISTRKDLRQTFDLLSVKSLLWHEDFFSSNRKGGKSDNSSQCWDNMETAAQNVLSMSRSGTSPSLSESEIAHLVRVIKFIVALKPDSLSPSDQSRCFLLLLSLTRAGCALGNLCLTSTCCKLLTCLISGKYSNGVFKLLYASDILEIAVGSLLKASWEFANGAEINPQWPDFIQTVQSFLESFLGMVVERKQSVLLNLEKFLDFVVHSIPGSEDPKWNIRIGHLLLIALNTLCKLIKPCLQEQHLNKHRTQSLSSLLQEAVVKMGMVLHQCLKVSEPTQMLPSFLVSCVTTLLEAELSRLSLMDTTHTDVSDKMELQNVELYKSFCSQILRELCCAEDQITFVRAALHYLTICIGVKEIHDSQESLIISIFSALKKLLKGPWVSIHIIQSVESELTELFSRMVQSCSDEEFYVMMKLVLQWLEVTNLWKQDYKEPFASITLIKLLLSCPLHGDCGKLFWFTAPQIITALVTLCKEACKDRSLLPTIVVPVLESLALLLRRGESFLTNPHHITLSFSVLLTVPLDHLKADDYYSMFLGVHEVLFSILQCHSKAMLKAVPSFLSSFHRLVLSVMHEGRQRGDKGTAPECEVILQCARLVERMYTHIAAKTEEFTVFSAFIVSQYVNELQKVTLQPAVKKHLTEGIFHILDLCIDRDIKFLNASLQMGVREVFKELYNEYIHYHKTKNQGEEKYTA